MEVNLPFLLCFTLYLRAIFQVQAPGGLYLEGRFNGAFFCVTGLGGLYVEGLIHGGAYLRNFTVFFFVFKYRINFAGNCSSCSIVSQRKELQYLRCYCAKMVTFLLSYISYFKSVCYAVNVVVQSYPWSKFLFSLHQTFNIQYHTKIQRNEVKFEPSTDCTKQTYCICSWK